MAHRRAWFFVLERLPLCLWIAVVTAVGLQRPEFLEPRNLMNVLIQASSGAIVAAGMTFVLLTAGIDLSVGAVMLIAAAVAGKMALAGLPLWLVLAAAAVVGAACGLVNAFFIVRVGVLPFVATLAALYFGRGLGLWITETRAMNLPESLLQLGTARPFGIPSPVIAAGLALTAAHVLLTRTAFGRHACAIGNDLEAARKAGIRTSSVLVRVYVLSGVCAAVGGMVSVAQLGAVSPTFGKDREFLAVATAVLGGTSLFGGRGSIFPGVLIGAIVIHTIDNALEILGVDVYVRPLITAGVIFLAVLIDSVRQAHVARLGRRRIR